MVEIFFNSLIKYKTNRNQSLSATLHLHHVYACPQKTAFFNFEKDYLVKINIFELKLDIQ